MSAGFDAAEGDPLGGYCLRKEHDGILVTRLGAAVVI